jgi:hypothetical protein
MDILIVRKIGIKAQKPEVRKQMTDDYTGLPIICRLFSVL